MKIASSEPEYLERLLNYTDACLSATCKEAEKSVEIVAKLLDALTQDIARISSMSQDTVSALQSVRDILRESQSENKTMTAVGLRSLAKALSAMHKEHHEISDVIAPLVTTLQFQDRVRQQMENLVKMLRIWMEYRTKNPENTEENLLEFGSVLGKPTTTDEEREVLKQVFPGLTFSEKIDNSDDFFFS